LLFWVTNFMLQARCSSVVKDYVNMQIW
jgi:hypothetical protein